MLIFILKKPVSFYFLFSRNSSLAIFIYLIYMNTYCIYIFFLHAVLIYLLILLNYYCIIYFIIMIINVSVYKIVIINVYNLWETPRFYSFFLVLAERFLVDDVLFIISSGITSLKGPSGL